ncbi:MAG: molybdenum cofactor biosynthesis protein MoeB [Euryarchaeota archaeon]|jgi:adenylyltransferase/sulfurtransferase|nr:molybdenum cofactor biosynthesis protein MoeB [Euryarchaeota archaeon]|tara:strand:+ start:1421 stop:2521 length:1101 start_codon:yes stop_codon:yes gene_type:complete
MADHLSDEERERYARHLVLPLVGESGQARLLESSVLVVGAGGLGSPALLYLAAAGVGKIGIIDHDSVDISNLQRQVIHVSSEIGEAKAESASRRLYELNGDGQFLPIVERLTETNALSIISEYDVVIDGTDNFESRYLIGDACEILGKPWVFGSVHRFEGQVSTFNHDGGPNYRDLFPEPPPPELAPNCAEAGVLGVLPGLVGTIQATEALKIILDIGDSLNGKLLAIDSLTMITRVLTFNRNSERATVTALEGDPMQMKSISPLDFVSKKNSGWTPFLLDVRSEREEGIASLDATDLRITHTSVPERISEIPSDRDIVVYCRTGGRSAAVVRFLVQSGWDQERVLNLDGGIHLWSDTVDSDIVKY